MKLGVLALGRPTFDVEFAREKLAAMMECLRETGHQIVGGQDLLFDEDATKEAIAALQAASIDQLVLLQVTFTDASMTVAAANAFDVPMSIWAVREPRDGGRLRLNAFCGLNLASHALGLNGKKFGWLLGDPGAEIMDDLGGMLDGKRTPSMLPVTDAGPYASDIGAKIAKSVQGKRVARIGAHPVGFDTCAYDKDEIHALAGVSVDAFELDDLFAQAANADEAQTQAVREQAERTLDGLAEVDQAQLDRSLRLKVALDAMKQSGKYDAFAIRCWPETFTEYGGAICGPVSMMGEARVPCACEADVYGALTQLVLQEVADAPVFLADLVDMDEADNSGVVWHCGQAPVDMRDPDAPATATLHTNRKMPLLYQFPLKPGPVTFCRISQAQGEPKMVISFGEMIRRPMAYTGTSGTVRFERDAGEVLHDVIASGLEHHMALAYGDHRDALRAVAAAMNLPLLEI